MRGSARTRAIRPERAADAGGWIGWEADEMTRSKITVIDLRPTQLTLGLKEVRERAKKIGKLSQDELNDFIDHKAIPHVIGPEERIYMVDHHHLARALLSIHIDKMTLGEQLADWSDFDIKTFWRKMDKKGYCWPIDADGNRRPYSAIPDRIEKLTDNVWRSLARELRGRAFENLDTPFQEFIWGDYFRTFMSRRLIELNFELAVDLAAKLARLDEAEDLPGFKA
jgi:hypothetical protein